MSIGLLGRKVGMTQVFAEDGTMVPVSVVAVEPNTITELRTLERDGYIAVQVGVGTAKRTTKPRLGQLKDLPRVRDVREFRVDDVADYEIGQQLDVSLFEAGDSVHVTGTSKGKGFAGVIKRHHMKGTRATHGTHETFRHGGSIGQKEFPAKVWKGHKMAGQLGNKQITVQNVAVVRVDLEDNLILLEGGVPGGKRTTIMLHPGSKAKIKAV